MNHGRGRVVIIGGSSGVGLAAARHLAAAGAEVVITARDPKRLAAARDSIDGAVSASSFDARDGEALTTFFAGTGPFHHLVLAMSSGSAFGPFSELDEGRFRATFENKFWPYVNAARAALDTLAPEGSITFVAGSAARKAGRGMSAIAATNGALVALVRPMALELAPLRVNAVCPGLLDTPYWDGVPDARRQEMFDWSAAHVPVGRVGTAEDIAHAIAFLIDNTFTTGTILDCNGGVHVT